MLFRVSCMSSSNGGIIRELYSQACCQRVLNYGLSPPAHEIASEKNDRDFSSGLRCLLKCNTQGACSVRSFKSMCHTWTHEIISHLIAEGKSAGVQFMPADVKIERAMAWPRGQSQPEKGLKGWSSPINMFCTAYLFLVRTMLRESWGGGALGLVALASVGRYMVSANMQLFPSCFCLTCTQCLSLLVRATRVMQAQEERSRSMAIASSRFDFCMSVSSLNRLCTIGLHRALVLLTVVIHK